MRTTPLEVFVFIGTFIEEVVSPIPSFIVMVPAGVAAHVQEQPLIYLVLLATIASCGRIIGGSLLYFLADKLEDVIFANGRRFFGVTHEDVEGFGKKLSSKRAGHSWLVLFLLSAIPFLPTAALSMACGFIKVRFSTFVTSNFLGSIINGLFFLWVGYAGLETAKLFGKFEFATQVAVIIALVAATCWLVYKKKRPKK